MIVIFPLGLQISFLELNRTGSKFQAFSLMYAVISVSKCKQELNNGLANSWSLKPKQNITKLNYLYDLIARNEWA